MPLPQSQRPPNSTPAERAESGGGSRSPQQHSSRAPFVAPKGWVVAPKPKRVPQDLKEGSRVALYYGDPYNEWWFGTLVTVNRRKTSSDNVQVRFQTEVYNQLLEPECYGRDFCWLLLIKVGC